MYHCRFRALTELGDPFYFSVADVPVKVYPDMFILAARSGTPILRASTIGRAMDHMQLAEGDQVLIDGKRYILGYHRGFTFRGDSGIIIPSNAVESYKLMQMDIGEKSKFQFKYRDSVFQLPSLFGCVEGKAVLSIGCMRADPQDIQVSAGFTCNKKKIFYGDILDGGEVIMWRGRPCVQREGYYVEMPTGNLLGGVEA